MYLLKTLIDYRKETSAEERAEYIQILKPLRYIAWVLAYLLLIYVFGFIIATAVFLFVFLIYESRMKVMQSLLSMAITLVVVTYLSAAINIEWPASLLGL